MSWETLINLFQLKLSPDQGSVAIVPTRLVGLLVSPLRLALILILTIISSLAVLGQSPQAPVDPTGTEEVFEPVTAKFLRMSIRRTNLSQPAIDELEVFGPEAPLRNLARQAEGAIASASSALSSRSSVVHDIALVNDGIVGNASSWVSGSLPAWLMIELPSPVRIHRIRWSRDRSGFESTRCPTDYVFEVSLDGEAWQAVADSSDRAAYRERRAGPKALPAPVPRIGNPIRKSRSSEYIVTQWGPKQGLPGTDIRAIAQTPDGYLWLGGRFGLARFDGREFSIVQPKGLVNGHLGTVIAMVADSRGRLWVSTALGRIGQMSAEGFDEKAWGRAPIYALAPAEDGTVWGASPSGLCSMKGDADTVALEDGAEGTRIVAVNNSGQLIYDRFGALRERTGAESLGVIESGTGGAFYGFAVCSRRQGGAWIFDHQGKLRALLPRGKATLGADLPFAVGPAREFAMIEDQQENLWFAVNETGLYRVGRDGACEWFDRMGAGQGAGGPQVLFEDSLGCIWVGTREGGLFRLRRRLIDMLQVGPNPSAVVSLAGNQTGEIYALDRRGQIFQLSKPESVVTSLPSAWSMMCDLRGTRFFLSPRVWTGQSVTVWERDDEGLFRKAANWGRPNEIVTAAYRDSAGRVKFGIRNGIGTYDNGRWTVLPSSWEREPTFGMIRCIAESGNGDLFLASDAGALLKVSGDTGTSIPLPFDASRTPVRTLYVDARETLWIGTMGAGLWRYREGQFLAVDLRSGLPALFIKAVIEDRLGNLWIADRTGFYRVPLNSLEALAAGSETTLRWSFIGDECGLGGAQATGQGQPNAWSGHDGQLYFATTTGVAILDPSQVDGVTKPLVVSVARPEIDGELVDRSESGTDDPLIVPAGKAVVSFRLEAPHISNPNNVRLQYRLKGWDETWQNAGRKQRVDYYRLPPGDYRFQARASLGEGSSWSTSPNLRLRVEALFWQTQTFGWLVGLLAVLLGAVGFVFTSNRNLNAKLRSAERSRSVDRERARIASDMHDRLGGRLTYLGLMAEEVTQQVPPDLSTRFRSSLNDAVRGLDEIVWAIDPAKDDLESLVAYCMNLVDEFSESSETRWRIETPDQGTRIPVFAAQRHEIFLAIQEAMTNVTKHAKAKEARLSIRISENELSVEIEDFGRGFDLDKIQKAGGGNGLKNIRSRLARVGGRAGIEATEGKGSRITLTLPNVGVQE